MEKTKHSQKQMVSPMIQGQTTYSSYKPSSNLLHWLGGTLFLHGGDSTNEPILPHSTIEGARENYSFLLHFQIVFERIHV